LKHSPHAGTRADEPFHCRRIDRGGVTRAARSRRASVERRHHGRHPIHARASSDTFQRLVAKRVTEDTGQTVIVESRPGGGGSLAAAVKRALPDGHTLFQANSGTHAANVTLYPSLPYDAVKDFAPITLMWSFPSLLVVPADSPAKSVADFAAYAKTKPGGSALRAVGLPTFTSRRMSARSVTPRVRRVPCSDHPWLSWPTPFLRSCWRARSQRPW
jgi:hypothetical protein